MNSNEIFGTSLSDLLDTIISDDIDRSKWRGQHFEIVSKVAYLLGIDRKFFESDAHAFQMDVFRQLDVNRQAKIIRNLCMLRSQLELNFSKIRIGIQQQYKSITQMPEYISMTAFTELSDSGIDLYRYRKEPTPFLIALNQNIQNRIGNCRRIFPDWLAWEYLRKMFVFPDGLTEEGTKHHAEVYYANFSCYPYGAFINWEPEPCGNIFSNDRKFVRLLYEWNGDEFQDWNLVSDVSIDTKERIYEFIERSDKTVFMVDCENSDPYALCAALLNLEPRRLEKIEK